MFLLVTLKDGVQIEVHVQYPQPSAVDPMIPLRLIEEVLTSSTKHVRVQRLLEK